MQRTKDKQKVCHDSPEAERTLLDLMGRKYQLRTPNHRCGGHF